MGSQLHKVGRWGYTVEYMVTQWGVGYTVMQWDWQNAVTLWGNWNIYRRSVMADLEPKMLSSCSSYASIFLFMMSMQGPRTRSNAATSRTTDKYTDIQRDMQTDRHITLCL